MPSRCRVGGGVASSVDRGDPVVVRRPRSQTRETHRVRGSRSRPWRSGSARSRSSRSRRGSSRLVRGPGDRRRCVPCSSRRRADHRACVVSAGGGVAGRVEHQVHPVVRGARGRREATAVGVGRSVRSAVQRRDVPCRQTAGRCRVETVAEVADHVGRAGRHRHGLGKLTVCQPAVDSPETVAVARLVPSVLHSDPVWVPTFCGPL